MGIFPFARRRRRTTPTPTTDDGGRRRVGVGGHVVGRWSGVARAFRVDAHVRARVVVVVVVVVVVLDWLICRIDVD